MTKKKKATTKPSGESSAIGSPLPERPLVIDIMANRGGERNRTPRRTLGDYAYQ